MGTVYPERVRCAQDISDDSLTAAAWSRPPDSVCRRLPESPEYLPSPTPCSSRSDLTYWDDQAALGLARLKKDGRIEGLGPGTRLAIQVREPGSHHALSVQQLQRWIDSVSASPAQTLKKAKLRQPLKP